jgi:uncharacterized delta-60 repeat protein
MRGAAIVLTLCFLVCAPGLAGAADGDLDSSFGGTGVVAVPVTDVVVDAGGLVLQPDGRIVVSGRRAGSFGADGSLVLARFGADGSPDGTFGTGGQVTTVLSGGGNVVVHPDGSLYVLRLNGDILLSRFSATGDLDIAFGTGGVVTTDCGGSEGVDPTLSFGSGDFLVMQPDGKLIVGVGSDAAACVVRYGADGVLDATFGTAGIALVAGFSLADVALQADGKILLAGRDGASLLPAVARLQADGVVDLGFDGDGLVTSDAVVLPPDHQYLVGVAVQPDGGVVATAPDFTLLRWKSDGKPDATFGAKGVADLPIAWGFDGYGAVDLATQPDGKLVVGGIEFVYIGAPLNGVADGFVLARVRNDGLLDPSYGVGGVSEDGVTSRMTTLRIQPDGKAVAVGSVMSTPLGTAWLIARTLAHSNGCPAAPVTGCKSTTAPAGASLKIRNVGSPSKKNQMQWKWKGDATTLAELADPIGGDDYAFCVYDAGTLASHAVVSGGGACKAKPCWKPLGTTGLGYSDSRKLAYGIGSIKLKSGAAGAAQIQLKAQGVWTVPPSLPLGSPVLVQLASETGACWEAVYVTPTKNDGVSFQAKSD